MATRVQIASEIDGVVGRLLRAKAIFLVAKAAGDEVRYVDENPDLPWTLTQTMKQQYAAAFDRLIDEAQATLAAWG